MKISLLEPLNVPNELIEELARPIEDMGHEFVYYDEKTTDVDELTERTGDSDIVIIANNSYPKEAFENAENLKLINVAFTGIDHVDTEAAKEKGVKVANAAGYSDQSVAELVIGLILNVYRQITVGNEDIRRANFTGPIQGIELKGKTVGIIGTGNIGLQVAELLKAFGVNLIAYSNSEKQEALDLGVEYKSLDEVMSESDIVTIHVPNNKETKGMISREKLSLMKDSAILINCARGPIIDNDALAELLNNDQIAGAGIDVFDMEPPIPSDYDLLHAKNAVLTPHVAFLTDEAMVKRANIVFDTTTAYLNGEEKNIQIN